MTNPARQKGPKVDLDPVRWPAPWMKVEEFVRDYARDLTRLGEGVVVAGRVPARALVVEVGGPAVFLEMSGPERRLGVVAPGERSVLLPGPRHRLLVLEQGKEGIRGRFVRTTDHGLETNDLPFDLTPGSGEWSRLASALDDALVGRRNPNPRPDEWEEDAERVSQALRLALAVARAGRRVVLDAANRASRGLRQFEQIVALLREKYREELPLPVVAETIGLSPRHFARLLDQWSGAGFTEHVLMVRLMQARQRLTHSRATVEEIAGAAGFGSRDHFIRAFRQYFGSTPLRYRKMWRAASEGRGKWESVLRIPGRNAVEWLPANTITRSPGEEPGKFHTLVIANATNEVRSLHRIGTDGTAMPEGALQPGEAIFVHRTTNHGFWRVGNALGLPIAVFRSPGPRALAMITG